MIQQHISLPFIQRALVVQIAHNMVEGKQEMTPTGGGGCASPRPSPFHPVNCIHGVTYISSYYFNRNVRPADDLFETVCILSFIPLFTEDNKLMSIDRAHLTYFGARKVGKIIFSDIRLNDLK